MDLRFDKSVDGRVEIIIALVTMIYIIETKLYDSHPMDEQVFNDFINVK